VIVNTDHHLKTDKDCFDPVYYKLAAYLDKMPAGFPTTESGVELRILRRFFNPDEAALALHVTLIPEEARVIARRAKISREEAKTRLEELAKKGLIYNIESNNKPTTYMSNQLVIGIWEYHVNDLDPDLINDMNEYLPTLMQEAWKIPQLRTIPVDKSITPTMEISTYENAEELIKNQKNIAVAPCICRREKSLVGEGCQAPEEVCLVFGSAADYYQRNGLGRIIDHQEALDILKKAEEAGLVLQPSNAQKTSNICCCCGCCCAVLRTIKKYPKPVELISTPFYVVSDPESCDGCSTCIDRCPMEALTIEDYKSVVNRDRCIGCGLCVTTCPTDSLHLVRKPEKEQPLVPKNNIEKYIQLGRSRGKLRSSEIVMMQVKSKVDRLLASKK
jgi:electron transport complex protein RnfB